MPRRFTDETVEILPESVAETESSPATQIDENVAREEPEEHQQPRHHEEEAAEAEEWTVVGPRGATRTRGEPIVASSPSSSSSSPCRQSVLPVLSTPLLSTSLELSSVSTFSTPRGGQEEASGRDSTLPGGVDTTTTTTTSGGGLDRSVEEMVNEIEATVENSEIVADDDDQQEREVNLADIIPPPPGLQPTGSHGWTAPLGSSPCPTCGESFCGCWRNSVPLSNTFGLPVRGKGAGRGRPLPMPHGIGYRMPTFGPTPAPSFAKLLRGKTWAPSPLIEPVLEDPAMPPPYSIDDGPSPSSTTHRVVGGGGEQPTIGVWGTSGGFLIDNCSPSPRSVSNNDVDSQVTDMWPPVGPSQLWPATPLSEPAGPEYHPPPVYRGARG